MRELTRGRYIVREHVPRRSDHHADLSERVRLVVIQCLSGQLCNAEVENLND